MAKQILFNEEARRALGKGVDALADAVKVIRIVFVFHNHTNFVIA